MHQYSGVKKGYRPARTSRGYRSVLLGHGGKRIFFTDANTEKNFLAGLARTLALTVESHEKRLSQQKQNFTASSHVLGTGLARTGTSTERKCKM